ncbi:MAG TPA: SurA N-terminal domain-containing protein, partial [Egibacteraceae bacterium]|nr:SurA N-terminal domain-containing protein [Egibacteraceae bacterium]
MPIRSLVRMRVALTVSAVLILAGCSPAAQVTGADPGAAATVNGEVVSMADAERRIEVSSGNPQTAAQLDADETGEARRQLEAGALTGLILSELLAQGAEELGISITDEDIQAARAEVVEQVGGEEGYQQVLAEGGLTEADVEPLLRDRAHQERIEAALAGEAEVTDEDIQARFDENPEGRFGATASARHILVETEPQAQEVIERLEAGE